MRVMTSLTANCALLLMVAIAMVVHTLCRGKAKDMGSLRMRSL